LLLVAGYNDVMKAMQNDIGNVKETFAWVAEKNNKECHMYNYCAVAIGFSYFPNKIKMLSFQPRFLYRWKVLVDET
jgi:hypothetical protein